MERFICPKCNGERKVDCIECIESFDGKRIRFEIVSKICCTCNGTGEVDWITNITHKLDNTEAF